MDSRAPIKLNACSSTFVLSVLKRSSYLGKILTVTDSLQPLAEMHFSIDKDTNNHCFIFLLFFNIHLDASKLALYK